ncbi:alpha/beta hydrolase [Halobacillus salinarum]|uniref:Alpha/beta hydrolase n=1 Tax=Halobacillus salinarum TaxID=2932257 RepID=A0ABY4EM03_9BACI|nr:alpha/beta hydrolase [Halobacillus salinarum]UOQ45472.1 alpha/beta hydrolase [Halobacillus salinarum]
MKEETIKKRQSKSLESHLPLGSFYKVEGRRMFLHRSGTAGISVVFLPAAGMVGLDYLNIHTKISQRTTSVIYDRAGTGWSDDTQLPRSAYEITEELRSLLQTAEIPPPYLFVGHSLGGLYACHYAQRFPEETAGMLLLEPPHEDFVNQTPKLKKRYLPEQGFTLLRTLLSYKRVFRRLFNHMFTEWPASIREPLIDYHLRSLPKTMTERKNLNDRLYEEVSRGGSIPDVPLIVFSTMGIDPFMPPLTSKSFLRETMEPFNQIKDNVYTKLAGSVPRGEHRKLKNAGHTTIHTDAPDEVIEAVGELLDRMENERNG